MITILESCFCLSLGITFILIIAIVYSINYRVNMLENNVKSTMTAIHGLLKEVVEINNKVGCEGVFEERECYKKNQREEPRRWAQRDDSSMSPKNTSAISNSNFLRDTDNAFLSNTSFLDTINIQCSDDTDSEYSSDESEYRSDDNSDYTDLIINEAQDQDPTDITKVCSDNRIRLFRQSPCYDNSSSGDPFSDVGNRELNIPICHMYSSFDTELSNSDFETYCGINNIDATIEDLRTIPFSMLMSSIFGNTDTGEVEEIGDNESVVEENIFSIFTENIPKCIEYAAVEDAEDATAEDATAEAVEDATVEDATAEAATAEAATAEAAEAAEAVEAVEDATAEAVEAVEAVEDATSFLLDNSIISEDVAVDEYLRIPQESTSILVYKSSESGEDKGYLKESYKKMSVAELKMRAISIAKCADPSKMKKQELIRMLLSATV